MNIIVDLYKQQAFFVKQGILPYGALLSKYKFSFNKIHMNIGKVRYYYTNSRFNDNKNINNRQELFKANYKITEDILEKNFYIAYQPGYYPYFYRYLN